MHSKENDEACLDFLVKFFTKSVHRGEMAYNTGSYLLHNVASAFMNSHHNFSSPAISQLFKKLSIISSFRWRGTGWRNKRPTDFWYCRSFLRVLIRLQKGFVPTYYELPLVCCDGRVLFRPCDCYSLGAKYMGCACESRHTQIQYAINRIVAHVWWAQCSKKIWYRGFHRTVLVSLYWSMWENKIVHIEFPLSLGFVKWSSILDK